jgi:adrenodoxin-NADP+ reductase
MNNKYSDLLKKCEDIIIIGQGNVSLDIARILSKQYHEIQPYDIPETQLKIIEQKKIKNIKVIGRRGPIEASFTTKEFKELSEFSNIQFGNEDLERIKNELSSLERPKKRQIETMIKVKAQNMSEEGRTIVDFLFFLKPIEIIKINDKISVIFEKTILENKILKGIYFINTKVLVNL